MWTAKNRGRYDRSKLRYPSDLTDDEWVSGKIAMTGAVRRATPKAFLRPDARSWSQGPFMFGSAVEYGNPDDKERGWRSTASFVWSMRSSGIGTTQRKCGRSTSAVGFVSSASATSYLFIHTRGGIKMHPGVKDELACRGFVCRTRRTPRRRFRTRVALSPTEHGGQRDRVGTTQLLNRPLTFSPSPVQSARAPRPSS